MVTRTIQELGLRTLGGAAIETVFVGGGTPTVLPIDDFRRLFAALDGVVGAHAVVEFTVEANPATLDDQKLSVMTAAGVNRLSMGAQSWHVDELAALERLHSPDDIAPGVAMARRHGIGNINLDLIFGIPGQTVQRWAESLRRTIDLGVEHIACYGLTYEPGTRLTAQRAAGRVTPCDDGIETDMYGVALETLAQNGYGQYEISNFARAGGACRHNMMYWRNRSYIGVGPSAAGCVNRRRYKNVADVAGYIRRMDADGMAEAESEHLTREMFAGEMLLMQLRLTDGLDVTAFRQATGLETGSAFGGRLDDFAERGLLRITEDGIALTWAGTLAADWVIAELYAAMDLSGAESQHVASAIG